VSSVCVGGGVYVCVDFSLPFTTDSVNIWIPPDALLTNTHTIYSLFAPHRRSQHVGAAPTHTPQKAKKVYAAPGGSKWIHINWWLPSQASHEGAAKGTWREGASCGRSVGRHPPPLPPTHTHTHTHQRKTDKTQICLAAIDKTETEISASGRMWWGRAEPSRAEVGASARWLASPKKAIDVLAIASL